MRAGSYRSNRSNSTRNRDLSARAGAKSSRRCKHKQRSMEQLKVCARTQGRRAALSPRVPEGS